MMQSSRHGIGEKGIALVETAIVLSLFLMMLFGIIDFGRAFYTYNFVSYAARKGTRYAIVRGSACSGCTASASDVENYVKKPPPEGIAEPGIDPTKMTVTTTWPDGNKNPRSRVNVQVQYNFQFILPFLPSSGWAMKSTSQMVISQ